jgi:nucleoside-diphosphate-sugar epimerase
VAVIVTGGAGAIGGRLAAALLADGLQLFNAYGPTHDFTAA